MTPAQLGARLAAARHAAGLSQRQVAAALGMHHPSIVQLELGRRGLSFLEAVQLTHLYSIDLTALVESDAPIPGTPRGLDAPPLQPAHG
jgi:transcriptional regulator with XRE-family HTH domain